MTGDPGSSVSPGASNDSGNVGWQKETRRYKRKIPGWFWLALLVIPLILALLGGLGRGNTGDLAVVDNAKPIGDFSLTSNGDGFDLTATVPDEDAKTSLIDAVQEKLGDDVTINDQVTVESGAKAVAPGAIAAVASEIGGLTGASADAKGGVLTLKGVAADDAVKSAVADVAQKAFPNATLNNGIIVGEGLSADCASINDDIKARLAEQKINFTFGSSKLDAPSVQLLDDIAQMIGKCEGVNLDVAGHTRVGGRTEVNQQISESRAAAVKARLVRGGVPAANITAQGFGGTQPLVAAESPQADETNRRVEITVK